MNRGEIIRKLKRKMTKGCNGCDTLRNKVYGYPSADYSVCSKCPLHILTNLMIEELNEN